MKDSPKPDCGYRYTAYAVVPTDPEAPLVGPFRITDGYSLTILKHFIKNELGLTMEQYSLRVIDEASDAFFDYHPDPKELQQ